MMEQDKQLRYFLYARKSSEDDGRQVQSTPDQIRVCTEYARSKEPQLRIVDIFEEAKSAKTPDNRPKFREMMNRIKRGEADAILCWKLDRLSRNSLEGGEIAHLLHTHIIKHIQTIGREFKSDDNVLYYLVESGMDTQFSRDLIVNVNRGMDGKRKLGWFPHKAPQGYINVRKYGNAYIEKDPSLYPIVRKMWDYMLTGRYSVDRVLELSNENWGFRTRRTPKGGDKKLSRSGLYKILTNPFYYGVFFYQGKPIQASHPAMITEFEYDAVQQLLGRRGVRRPQVHDFAYTGLIRCSECGCYYTAETKRKFNKRSGQLKNYTYYHCTHRAKYKKCTQYIAIKEDDLHAQVEQLISRISIPTDFRDWALDVLKGRHDKEVSERQVVYETHHGNLVKAQRCLDNLTTMRIKEMIDDEEYLQKANELKLEIAGIKKQLRGVEERAESWQELTEKAFTFAAHAKERFETGDTQTKKLILKTAGQNFFAKDGKISMDFSPWLKPIVEGAVSGQIAIGRLEPNEANKKAGTYVPAVDTWCAMKDSNLRPAD